MQAPNGEARPPTPTHRRRNSCAPHPTFCSCSPWKAKPATWTETGLRCTLQPGSLIWAVPGVNQSYGPKPGERWSELFLWFRGPLFEAWQGSGFPGERSRHLELNPLNYWNGIDCAASSNPRPKHQRSPTSHGSAIFSNGWPMRFSLKTSAHKPPKHCNGARERSKSCAPVALPIHRWRDCSLDGHVLTVPFASASCK